MGIVGCALCLVLCTRKDYNSRECDADNYKFNVAFFIFNVLIAIITYSLSRLGCSCYKIGLRRVKEEEGMLFILITNIFTSLFTLIVGVECVYVFFLFHSTSTQTEVQLCYFFVNSYLIRFFI